MRRLLIYSFIEGSTELCIRKHLILCFNCVFVLNLKHQIASNLQLFENYLTLCKTFKNESSIFCGQPQKHLILQNRLLIRLKIWKYCIDILKRIMICHIKITV